MKETKVRPEPNALPREPNGSLPAKEISLPTNGDTRASGAAVPENAASAAPVGVSGTATASPNAPNAPAVETPPIPASDKSSEPVRANRSWLKWALLVGLLALVLVGARWGLGYWRYAQAHVSTDDAYLTTTVTQITPQVEGEITGIPIHDNQEVKAGQLLVTLDDSTYRVAVAQARADLQVAQATAAGAASSVSVTTQTGNAQIEQASGGVAQAESGVAWAQSDAERADAAVTNTQADVRSARANVTTAQAGMEVALSAKQRAIEAVRAAQAQVETAQAGVKAAQANVAAAKANAERADKDAARYAELFRENAVSAQSVDALNAAAATARAQLDSAQQGVAQAQATVAQKQADLQGVQEAVHTADATIAQAKAQTAAAQAAVAASLTKVRQAQAQFRAAQQNVTLAQAKRAQALGQLNQARTAPKQVAVSQANHQTANAHILEAQAALENAEIALRRTRIYAPAGGTIRKNKVDVGQHVAIGQPIFSLIPKERPWIVANFKETQLPDVRPGERAEVEVDTFPGHKYVGRVDSIAPATGATFALLPPDNASGNFTKVVQRIAVKIVFDPNQKDLERLRGGLSAVATITTR